MLTDDIMRKMWPRAPRATLLAIVNSCDEVFEHYELNTPLRVAHFMAQISHECGRGTIVRENMNYSPQRILEVFGVGKHSAKVTPAEAQAIGHHPELLAERVYGTGNPKKAQELGNTAFGDAYRCRGNGMLQLTGAGAHKRIGKMINYDLYTHPEVLEGPAASFEVAAAEFKALGCLSAADADNVTLVTRRVNGPNSNGLPERAVLTRQWKAMLPGIEAPATMPRGAEDLSQKSILSSKIMQGAGGTAASIATAVGAKVAETANTTTSTVSVNNIAEKVQQASDAVTTISVAKDNVTAIVQTVKPFLGLAPNTWAAIAILAITIAVLAVGYTMYQRYVKLRDQGV